MIENTFVVVGTILRIDRIAAGLRLVIGGRGPVKVSAAVEVHDPALAAILLDPAKGFRAGDAISAGGRMVLDETTGQNVAVADRARVALVARGTQTTVSETVARAALVAPPQAAGTTSEALAPPVAAGTSPTRPMFAGRPAPGAAGQQPMQSQPLQLPAGFPSIDATEFGDVPF